MTTVEIKEQVRARDGYKCVKCGLTQEEFARRQRLALGNRSICMERLHVHRRVQDGEYSLENCETLCPSCHSKQRRDITGEWRRRPRKRLVQFSVIGTVCKAFGWNQRELATNLFGEAALPRVYDSYPDYPYWDPWAFYPNEQEAAAIRSLFPVAQELEKRRQKDLWEVRAGRRPSYPS